MQTYADDLATFKSGVPKSVEKRRKLAHNVVEKPLFVPNDLLHVIPSPLHLTLGLVVLIHKHQIIDCMIVDGDETMINLQSDVDHLITKINDLKKQHEELSDTLGSNPDPESDLAEQQMDQWVALQHELSTHQQKLGTAVQKQKARAKEANREPGATEEHLLAVLSLLQADPHAYFGGTFVGNQIKRMLHMDPAKGIDNPSKMADVFEYAHFFFLHFSPFPLFPSFFLL
jgi:hypothetical protein